MAGLQSLVCVWETLKYVGLSVLKHTQYTSKVNKKFGEQNLFWYY